MTAGEAADLLEGVTTEDGFYVDYSINDEHLLVGGGAEDTAALQSLGPGVYSLHCTALEERVDYTGGQRPGRCP